MVLSSLKVPVGVSQRGERKIIFSYGLPDKDEKVMTVEQLSDLLTAMYNLYH